METRIHLKLLFAAIAVAAAVAQAPVPVPLPNLPGQVSPLQRTVPEDPGLFALRLSDSEMVALVKSSLDEGLLSPRSSGATIRLAAARSALVVPLIEAKIEQVLKSPKPSECFPDASVDPQSFVDHATVLIWQEAHDENALKAIGELLKLDEKRFDRMVSMTLNQARSPNLNEFALAYRGLDLSNRALGVRIVRWAEERVAHEEHPHVPGSSRNLWAEAMVDRYGGVPTPEQWGSDPMVAGMKPDTVKALRDDMYRQMEDIWDKRTLASRMSDAEQTAFTKSQLDLGIPDSAMDKLKALASGHSSLILPLIEAKAEEMLRSVNPSLAFTGKSVDPEEFFNRAFVIISEVADEQALRQAAKLLKLRPAMIMTELIFHIAEQRGNPFALVYQGLAIGDENLDRKIMEWVAQSLAEPAINAPEGKWYQWAEALVDRYGAAPAPAQLARDPIASRLKPDLAKSAPEEITRLAFQAVERRTRK